MEQMVLTVLGVVAQMECWFLRERQLEGIELAKARGSYAGGKRQIDRGCVIEIAGAKNTVSMIASAMGCSDVDFIGY